MSNNDWFQMPYYHVYIEYVDKRGQPRSDFVYGCTEEYVRERIAIPYTRNKEFLCGGRTVHPSSIDTIHVFESEEWNPKKIILPNGQSILGQRNAYILNCFLLMKVEGVKLCTWKFITSPPEATIGLMDSASFLGLDDNWSSATCALQLQEVSTKILAKKKNIKLNKANVEKILNKKIKDLSFNDQYEAFSKQVKDSFGVDMPILTTHLRRIRAKVLHEGYNPKPEETDSIVSFTIGLLKKLENIS